jgi:hypothetical protein
MKTVILFAVVGAALLSCATTPPPPPSAPIRDFTNMEFVEVAYRPIQNPDFESRRFIIESNIEIPDLPKAKATLMFKDLVKDAFLEETFPLLAVFDETGKKNRLLATDVNTKVNIEDKRKPNILFVVKIQFDNTIFYSNVQKPYTPKGN